MVLTIHSILGETLPTVLFPAAVIAYPWYIITDREASKRTLERAAMAAGSPLLGVCFDHQLMAQPLGRYVDERLHIREVWLRRATAKIEAADDALINTVPATLRCF